MIYSDTLYSSKQEFEDLLSKTRTLALAKIDTKQVNNGNKFEKFVFDILTNVSKGTLFEGNFYQTADREFPDIILKGYWGIEVKFTKDDKWKSIGNSVLESSRIPNVEKIYLFFGKCGGIPDIKYRNYEECLSGVAVTHYPRYEIDMNLEEGKSIFERMGVSYDQLRKDPQPAKIIRKFYKSTLKENSSLWWIDNEEKAQGLEIKFFSDLDIETKQTLIAEGFILYPDVINSKFAKLCAYWVNNYSIICPNMRDQYSAGGIVSLNKIEQTTVNGTEIKKVYYNVLFKYKNLIIDILEQISLEIVSECWDKEIFEREEMKKEWVNRMESYLCISLNVSLADYFGIK